jgi:hypothetical protein
MSKQTKKVKKDIPVIIRADHPDARDLWIRELSAKFKPPSSSSHKTVVDIFKNNLQNTFRPSSSSYIERRVDDVSVTSSLTRCKDIDDHFKILSDNARKDEHIDATFQRLSDHENDEDEDETFNRHYDYESNYDYVNRHYDHFNNDEDMSDSNKERKDKHYAKLMSIQGNLSYKYSSISSLS